MLFHLASYLSKATLLAFNLDERTVSQQVLVQLVVGHLWRDIVTRQAAIQRTVKNPLPVAFS